MEHQFIHGISLAYQVVGQGDKTVLCLHDYHSHHHIFDEIVPLLSANYRLVLVDYRGYGQSKLGKAPLSLDLIKEDVMTLMEILNIKHYSILGYSEGAKIALKIVSDAPYIESLILLSPSLNFKAYRFYFRILFLMRYLCLLPLCLYHPGARLERKKMLLLMEDTHMTLEDLQHIKIPVALFNGEYDIIQSRHFINLASSLPYCHREEIQHSGHDMLIPLHHELFNKIKLFLDCL